MKIIEALIVGASQALLCETERSVKTITESGIHKFVIKRREIIPGDLSVVYYASDRKSKGEKKRAASANRRKGWK